MYSLKKLSFLLFITFFFYQITLHIKNPTLDTFSYIEKKENIFLSMIHNEHTTYIQQQEFLRIEAEKKAAALAKKKMQIKIAARLVRIQKAKEIERQRQVVLKRIARTKAREHTKRIELARIAKAKKAAHKRQMVRDRDKIIAKVDISQQKMKVYKGGKLIHKWKVSTGKKGHNTPTGRFRPTIMEKMHFSRQYDNAPMPYSIFFNAGIAVHGTKSIRRLGRRASHGCVRVHTNNAKKLYALIQKSGRDNSYIEVHK